MTATPPKIRLGGILRARMQQLRIPQCELAKTLNISPAAVSQMLSGRRSFRRSFLLQTCELLQIPAAEQEDLLRLLNTIRSGDHHQPADPGPDIAGTPSVADLLAEPAAQYRMEPRRIPVFPAAKLTAWDGSENLLSFASRHATAIEPVWQDYPPECCFVEGSGREFGIHFYGRVQLTAVTSRPAGYREMELVHLRTGGFRIRERVGGVWRLFRIGDNGSAATIQADRRLRLPIIGVMLCPEQILKSDK